MGKNYSKKYVLLFAFLMLSIMAFAQNGSISGKVVDESNQPLPGATVTINGSTNGAAADANGNYVIRNVKAGTYTLSAKFLGYDVLTKTVTVNGAVTVSFNLLPSTKSLNEVVVIGYGTQTRKEVTGAISTVGSKDFQKGTITSPEQLIQGKIAGVSITTNGGQPGSGSVIRIRQGASLNASSDPLIVIDGVPLSPNGISGVGSALSLINPDDIETYTVLKDAASTAIYGSRASNGVIIITTKKGAKGTPTVSVSSQNSIANTANRLDLLSADQIRTYVNANGTAAQKALLGKANTDWQDEIYQNAFTTNNNVSISGSTKTMPYRVSVGNLDQDGILKTDHINRTTTAIRLSPKFFNDDLKFDLNLNGSYQKSNFANTGAIGAAASYDPTQPVYDSKSPYNGYFEWMTTPGDYKSGLNPNAPHNPVGMLNDYHNTGNTYRSFGNLQTDYRFHFLPALHANLNLGYDISKGTGSVFVPANAAQSFGNGNSTNAFDMGGANTEYHQKNYNTVGEFYLNYNNTFKSIKSNVNATAGYGYYDFRSVTRNYANYNAAGALVVNSTPLYPYGEGRYTIESYYARAIYTYDTKYILAGSIRRDGSSKFAPNLRNATFPSVAFTWRMSDENFMKGLKDLSDFKLRLSYGVTGQQDGDPNTLPYYGYIPIYFVGDNSSQYQFGNTFYNMYTPVAYDTSLKWEQTSAYNAGIDYGFFDQRLSGAIDVYYKKTKDLLGRVYLPVGANFTNLLTTNVGNTETKGIEFSLNAIPVRTKDFSWSLNYNVAYNKNTITNLSAIKGLVVTVPTGGVSGATGTTVQLQSVGSTPNAFYVYKQVYNANGMPIEGVYADLNGDGRINDQDKYLYKSPYPKVTMGFSTNFDYKKWSLSTVLRANLGNYAYNNVASNLGVSRNIITVQNNINNASTDYYNTLFSNNQYLSDYYVQNASFLRMDNVGLGYNFGRIAKHVNLRLNANVQNVFVITKYKGIDPEIYSGIDNNFYPRPRTYTIGFNLGL